MTIITRLWRWLTAPTPDTCRLCGETLHAHPDGGAGAICPQCDKEMN